MASQDDSVSSRHQKIVSGRSATPLMYSSHRIQMLAQSPSADATLGEESPRSQVLSASGLSVQGLREAIRRVERGLESEIILSADSTRDIDIQPSSTVAKGSAQLGSKVHLKDSQLRMALWLNSLPIKKYVTWYPEVVNSHAVIIVRRVSDVLGVMLTSAEILHNFRFTIVVVDCCRSGQRASWSVR